MTPGKNPASAAPSRKRSAVKRIRADDEGHAARDDAPGQHDAGNPDARPDLLQRQVAGYLTNNVGDVEQTAAYAEGRMRQADGFVHLQGGKARIHPVEEGDEVTEHQERHQAERHLPHG